MTFAVFVPLHEPGQMLPVLWSLSSLTCSRANVMEKGERALPDLFRFRADCPPGRGGVVTRGHSRPISGRTRQAGAAAMPLP